jgi:segregation and condensation protein B
MNDEELKLIIEAVLMSSEKPLSLEQIMSVFDEWQKPKRDDINQALSALEVDYENRAIELKRLANGYTFQTRATYAAWVSRLQIEKASRYSRALLETLSIIAYRQPVTRADIEDIRGVAVSSSILKTLLERDWIKIAGHRDVPGKPAVFVTTKVFLDYFNLTTIHQLPPLPVSLGVTPVITEQPLEEYIE